MENFKLSSSVTLCNTIVRSRKIRIILEAFQRENVFKKS